MAFRTSKLGPYAELSTCCLEKQMLSCRKSHYHNDMLN